MPSRCKNRAKSEFDSHWCGPTFMNGDREIWTDYYDEDSSTLHVNIYKSNIPIRCLRMFSTLSRLTCRLLLAVAWRSSSSLVARLLSFASVRSAQRPRTVRQPQCPSLSASSVVVRSAPSRTPFHLQHLRCRRHQQPRLSLPASAVTAEPRSYPKPSSAPHADKK